jgi:hypothetical protein
MDKTMITICCQWDGGDYYPLDYVNKLYNMVERNTTFLFEFLLYAGVLAEENPGRLRGLNGNIRVEWSGLPFWWGGMKFWMQDPPGVKTPKLLYLDLDIVITGCIDELILYPSDHACMKDYPAGICPAGHERDVNTSVVLLKTGSRPEVWENYVRAGMPIWNVLEGPDGDRPLPLGAQTLINHWSKFDLFPENWVCSYKLHLVHEKGLPDDCRIVVFHGLPKMHQVNESFVRNYWR